MEWKKMINITKYEELKKFIQKFKEEHFDLIIIFSKGGLGKTFNANKILGDDVCKIGSHITPLGLFQYGYEYKDKLIWFDDVESLFNSDKLVGLMKQFSQTQPVKHIKFLTSRVIKNDEATIPKEYETKSKILMTCNSISRLKNPSVNALLDRGIIVFFSPSKKEMINYIKNEFKNFDKEVLNEISKKVSFSLRDYIKAYQLKEADFEDWREFIWKKK